MDAGGACKSAAFAGEEQAYFIAAGTGAIQYGEQQSALRSGDFFYVPPRQPHALSCAAGAACRAIAMGFKVADAGVQATAKLDVANIDAVKKQVVGNHPPSTLYQLMIGDAKSTRDRIAAGQVLTSLFIMEFTPGGTNFPHHHDNEEEIYLVLDGEGDMVAGGGIDGIEGRHKAKPGDAYFFRLNCTVGFYNSDAPGTKKARILAVRSLYPRRK